MTTLCIKGYKNFVKIIYTEVPRENHEFKKKRGMESRGVKHCTKQDKTKVGEHFLIHIKHLVLYGHPVLSLVQALVPTS